MSKEVTKTEVSLVGIEDIGRVQKEKSDEDSVSLERLEVLLGTLADEEAEVSSLKSEAPVVRPSDVDESYADQIAEKLREIQEKEKPDYKEILALAALMLEQFQAEMDNSKENLGSVLNQLGEIWIKAAKQAQKEIAEKIKELSDRLKSWAPKWAKALIATVLGPLGPLVYIGDVNNMKVSSFLQAGGMLGPLAGVFLEDQLHEVEKIVAGPLLEKTEQKYFEQFKAEGKSDAEAHYLAKEKAEHQVFFVMGMLLGTGSSLGDIKESINPTSVDYVRLKADLIDMVEMGFIPMMLKSILGDKESKEKYDKCIEELVSVVLEEKFGSEFCAKGPDGKFVNPKAQEALDLLKEAIEKTADAPKGSKKDTLDRMMERIMSKLGTAGDPETESMVRAIVGTFAGVDSGDVPLSQNEIIALAMIYLQEFQANLTEKNAEGSQLLSLVGRILVSTAMQAQSNVTAKMEEIEGLRKNQVPDWVNKLVAASVGISLTLFTAGSGAPVAMAVSIAMTAFMTFGFEPAAQALGGVIAARLEQGNYERYRNEGKSEDEARRLAKEKSKAEGVIVAKIVIAAMVAVVSGGVGTLKIAGGGGWSAGLRLGAAQGLGSIGGSGMGVDILQAADPDFIKNNPILAGVLGLVISLALAGGGMYGAYKLYSPINGLRIAGGPQRVLPGMSKWEAAKVRLSNFMSKVSEYAPEIAKGIQIGAGTAEIITSCIQADLQFKMAKRTKELAELQKEAALILGEIDIHASTAKGMRDSTEHVSESTTSQTKGLREATATDWDAVLRILQRV